VDETEEEDETINGRTGRESAAESKSEKSHSAGGICPAAVSEPAAPAQFSCLGWKRNFGKACLQRYGRIRGGSRIQQFV